MPHRVAVLALDGVVPMDLGIASRVFNEALDPAGARLYSVTTCSIGGRPVRTNEGFRIVVDDDESLLESADTVVIATQEPGEELLATGELSAPVAAALARIGPGARIVSLCTSAFLLAAAGLLDGLRATTHWALCDRFTRLFPDIAVDPDVLFVDNGRILTAAAWCGRYRPVPPPGPPGPRRDGGWFCGTAVRGGAVARGRSGAVHRAPGAEGRRSLHIGHPPVDAEQAGRTGHAAGHGPPRPYERAHIHPAVPRGGGHEPPPVAGAEAG